MTRRGLFAAIFAGPGASAAPARPAPTVGPPLSDFIFRGFDVWMGCDCEICRQETDGRNLTEICDRSTGLARIACPACRDHFKRSPVRLLTGNVGR